VRRLVPIRRSSPDQAIPRLISKEVQDFAVESERVSVGGVIIGLYNGSIPRPLPSTNTSADAGVAALVISNR